MSNCQTCSRELDNDNDPVSKDCGGDCRLCMADAGDPDCLEDLWVFSFGVGHSHSVHIDGQRFTFDTDSLIGIVGDIGKTREKMFEYFDAVWAMQYPYSQEKRTSVHFPRGVIKWIKADA
jgi:hypothetical protein